MADCIQRKWAAARARDAERDAMTGQGVDGSRCEATRRGDAGGTKRQRSVDDGARGAELQQMGPMGGGPMQLGDVSSKKKKKKKRGGRQAKMTRAEQRAEQRNV